MGILETVRQEVGKAFRPPRAGHEKVAIHRLALADGARLEVFSPAFADGCAIPRRHAGDGDDLSPPLSWTEVPAGTREVAVLCEDPDAPFPAPFVHWLVHGIPPGVRVLPAGVAKTHDVASIPGAHQGIHSGHDEGYTGPLPPPGHGVHSYYFQVFALDTKLALGDAPTRDELVAAMKGHVLAAGALIGTYVRD